MRNSIYAVTVDEALETVGGEHDYQLQVVTVGAVVTVAVGGTLRAVEYMNSDQTLAERFVEETEGTIGPVIWPFFLGLTLGSIFFGIFVDLIGRRKSLQVTCFGMLLGSTTASASLNNYFLYVSVPLCGFCLAGVFLSMLLTVVEVTLGKYRVRSPVILLSAVLAGYSASSFLSLFLPKWRLQWLLCAAMWACCQPLIQSLLESPRYLAAIRGKYGQARLILQHISEINRKSRFNDMLEGEKVIGYQEPSGPDNLSSSPDVSSKFAFAPITAGITGVSQAELTHMKRYFYWHLLALNSVRGNFVGIWVMWVSVGFVQYTTVQGSERVLEYGGGVGVGVCLWLSLLVAQRLGRLQTLLITFITTSFTSIISSLLLSFTCQTPTICHLTAVLSYSITFISLAGIESAVCILLIYTLELFPSAVRSPCLSVYMTTCGLICLLFPFLTPSLQSIHFKPELLSGLVLLCMSPIICIFTDTLGEDQSDYVQEEQEEMKKPVDLSQVDIQRSPQPPGNPFPFEPINEEIQT